MAGVVREAGVEDTLHGRVPRQELRDRLGILTVALHADGHGLDAAQRQPDVEGTRDRASRILVIEDGRIAEYGTHAELIRAGGHYYNLYTRQFRREREVALGL